MRMAFALLLLSSLVAVADDDTPVIIPKDPEPRFGVTAKLKAYPQHTAKRTLESAIEACEKEEFSYLIAHLLDPAFVNQRITDRAKQFEAQVEIDLIKLRDFQYANPDRFPFPDRVPMDRGQFAAVANSKSRELAFKQLARDVGQKLLDDPEAIRDLKKILRDGTFTDEASGTKAVHPTVKDKALFFKKIGDRWFLENRQEDVAKKEP